MSREEIEKTIRAGKVIAIIRGFAPEVCLKLAECYRKGGVSLVEVTFNQKDPASHVATTSAIRTIREHFGSEMHVGAGTVMTEEQLSRAVEAGAEYIISPNVDARVIRAAVDAGVAALPGAMTPSEAVLAWEAGASFVKIFPAGSLGPGYVKAIAAPLSHIPFLAVGGISASNARDFMAAGCVGLGVGGSLTNRTWIEAGEWNKIEAAAREIKEQV